MACPSSKPGAVLFLWPRATSGTMCCFPGQGGSWHEMAKALWWLPVLHHPSGMAEDRKKGVTTLLRLSHHGPNLGFRWLLPWRRWHRAPSPAGTLTHCKCRKGQQQERGCNAQGKSSFRMLWHIVLQASP